MGKDDDAEMEDSSEKLRSTFAENRVASNEPDIAPKESSTCEQRNGNDVYATMETRVSSSADENVFSDDSISEKTVNLDDEEVLKNGCLTDDFDLALDVEGAGCCNEASSSDCKFLKCRKPSDSSPNAEYVYVQLLSLEEALANGIADDFDNSQAINDCINKHRALSRSAIRKGEGAPPLGSPETDDLPVNNSCKFLKCNASKRLDPSLSGDIDPNVDSESRIADEIDDETTESGDVDKTNLREMSLEDISKCMEEIHETADSSNAPEMIISNPNLDLYQEAGCSASYPTLCKLYNSDFNYTSVHDISLLPDHNDTLTHTADVFHDAERDNGNFFSAKYDYVLSAWCLEWCIESTIEAAMAQVHEDFIALCYAEFGVRFQSEGRRLAAHFGNHTNACT